jgi:Fe2+ or Zn2+ uptake regulation protein
MQRFDNLTALLRDAGIAPSVPRIRILEYLSQCCMHPTAEEVYQCVKAKDGSISKATVYNTLNVFAEKGMVRVLMMENNEHRYDIHTSEHGHFVCSACGSVLDFDADMSGIQPAGLCGCRIDKKDLYYRGVCQKCMQEK